VKRLGSDVTILEALPDFWPQPIRPKEAWKTFTAKQGLKINLGVKINASSR
jgi:dihydrolipoamide dehydrogenase